MHFFKALNLLCAGLILSCGFQVSSARSSVNIEPLLQAIRAENEGNVQRLTINQNLNVENRRGLTPLSVSVGKDNEPIAKLLIQNGADVNNAKGILKTAVEHGNEKMVELLTQNRVDVNKAESPLQLAAYKGNSLLIHKIDEIIVMLILIDRRFRKDRGYVGEKWCECINAEDVSGKTALHQAAAFGREKVAELLIKSGANVNKKDLQGKTALHLAAEHGHAKVVDLLGRNGADIDIVDNRGKTAAESASALTHNSSGRNRNQNIPK